MFSHFCFKKKEKEPIKTNHFLETVGPWQGDFATLGMGMGGKPTEVNMFTLPPPNRIGYDKISLFIYIIILFIHVIYVHAYLFICISAHLHSFIFIIYIHTYINIYMNNILYIKGFVYILYF